MCVIFWECTHEDQERALVLPSFSDGLRSLELVIAGLKAEREKRWVAVEELRNW